MYALGLFIFVGNEPGGRACMYIWQCYGGMLTMETEVLRRQEDLM